MSMFGKFEDLDAETKLKFAKQCLDTKNSSAQGEKLLEGFECLCSSLTVEEQINNWQAVMEKHDIETKEKLQEALINGKITEKMHDFAGAHPALKMAVLKLLDENLGCVFLRDSLGEFLDESAFSGIQLYEEIVIVELRKFAQLEPNEQLDQFSEIETQCLNLDCNLLLEIVDSGMDWGKEKTLYRIVDLMTNPKTFGHVQLDFVDYKLKDS